MLKLEFTKMQGAGNDFVVLDGIIQPVPVTPELIRALADRRFGIGADQVLLLEKNRGSATALRYRIFNNTGAEVEQCGNGARCIGRFALNHGYGSGKSVELETMKGLICVQQEADGRMVADMGVPITEIEQIPFDPRGLESRREGALTVWKAECPTKGCSVEFTVASMGNPHATIFVENVDESPVEEIGKFVQQLPAFPESVNVGFVQRRGSGEARIRVYERGAGETLACGTGTSAAMTAGVLRGLFSHRVEFAARGGALACEWQGPGRALYLIGPAEEVFTGTISLDV